MSAIPGSTAVRDVGFGTAYERWAVYQLLESWSELQDAKTALEGPIDGMAGIPGLHLLPLAKRGTRVTVVVPDAATAESVSGVYARLGLSDRLDARVGPAFPEETFDAVLTYNALPSAEDWPRYLEETAARARRWLVVSGTHPSSYGVFIRKTLRALEPGTPPPELFDHPSTRARVLEPLLKRLGEIVRDAYVDCPWWPDLFVPTGETLFSGTLGRLPFGKRFLKKPAAPPPPGAEGEAFLYGPERFPFFGGEGWKDELEPALKRHPVFDSAPKPVASLFAHHRVRLVRRGGAA